MYDMTEADETAAKMPRPQAALTYEAALKIVRHEMPGETETVISNTAQALVVRARYLNP